MTFYGPERIGQTLRGKLGSYTLIRQMAEQVWQATSSIGGYVTIKTLATERLLAERNNLARFQTRTPHIRPLIGEINPGKYSYALVLKHFDEDLSEVVGSRRLAKRELELVARNVLEALRNLHADGWIHADLTPSNILINRPEDTHAQITDAQLSDLEDAVPGDHPAPLHGKTEGTFPFVSPEHLLKMPWSTPTDIWSFGATMMSLIHGHEFEILNLHIWGTFDLSYSHKLLQRQNVYFGPFPASYAEIAD